MNLKRNTLKTERRSWEKLLLQKGYSKIGAKTASEKIVSMDSKLKQEFIRWMNTGVLPALTVEGFDLAGLIEATGMTETAAFLILDWLLRAPEAAKQALASPLVKLAATEDALAEIARAETLDREGQRQLGGMSEKEDSDVGE